ncbi:hypothetical protein PSV09DRAFT_2258445 [Bipolaris maydis]|nr:hypothetical protein J3E73DRAFT_410464 [Bipolaris maydis]KAJ5058725.1 hypothetical protein J3E74DRAFT_454889 [Bipolaris maydis]KAJ6208705.1 hypothetical protein PSV09DRAFT_2258445 [Bipolaris maydis]KAJ6277963.1 hypothetical protein J3E71DRAFT_370377 [Bipolaris maydis]
MSAMDESSVTEGTHFTCPDKGYHGLDVPEMGMGGRGGKQGCGLSSEPDCGLRRVLVAVGRIWILRKTCQRTVQQDKCWVVEGSGACATEDDSRAARRHCGDRGTGGPKQRNSVTAPGGGVGAFLFTAQAEAQHGGGDGGGGGEEGRREGWWLFKERAPSSVDSPWMPAMLSGEGSWKTRLLGVGERSSEQGGRAVGYLVVCTREQTWRLGSEVEGRGRGRGGGGGDDGAEGRLFVWRRGWRGGRGRGRVFVCVVGCAVRALVQRGGGVGAVQALGSDGGRRRGGSGPVCNSNAKAAAALRRGETGQLKRGRKAVSERGRLSRGAPSSYGRPANQSVAAND